MGTFLTTTQPRGLRGDVMAAAVEAGPAVAGIGAGEAVAVAEVVGAVTAMWAAAVGAAAAVVTPDVVIDKVLVVTMEPLWWMQLSDMAKQEAQRVVGGLRSQALSAEARASSLRARLNTLQRGVARDDQASVMAGSLERDAEAKRTAYARLAQAAQQSTQAQRVSTPQANIIENATIPTRPTFPKVKAFAAAGKDKAL